MKAGILICILQYRMIMSFHYVEYYDQSWVILSEKISDLHVICRYVKKYASQKMIKKSINAREFTIITSIVDYIESALYNVLKNNYNIKNVLNDVLQLIKKILCIITGINENKSIVAVLINFFNKTD